MGTDIPYPLYSFFRKSQYSFAFAELFFSVALHIWRLRRNGNHARVRNLAGYLIGLRSVAMIAADRLGEITLPYCALLYLKVCVYLSTDLLSYPAMIALR